jgi:RimJ/RimL family protein N-acetyltransferase
MNDPILLELPSRIETERLVLRAPQPGDGAVLFDAVTESLPDLRRFLGSLPWVAVEQSLESSEAYCRAAQADFIARRELAFLLFERAGGALVGTAGLHHLDWTTPKAELGYWGRTSSAGRGYVSEAVDALARFAIERLGAVRVQIVTDEANLRSRAVATRCGFALEGILRNERRSSDGTLRNTCVYARHGNVA